MSVNHLFSAFSFIGFVLVSVPFAWHLKTSNTATCFYMFWVSIACMTFFINSVVWDGNVGDWAPVWCDISSRITIAACFAFPPTCLCIQRRLYRIILHPSVYNTRAEKRKMIIVDMVLCLGIPILNTTLVCVVQTHRYEILGDIGCTIPIVDTALVVVFVPALKSFIGLTSSVYACLNIYYLWIKRRTIRTVLGSSTAGGLNFSDYLKLFILSGVDPFLTIPFNVWVLKTWIPVHPWLNWAEIHYDFSRVDKLPSGYWRSIPSYLIYNEWGRWNSVIYAFMFFSLFGMTNEARRHYKSALKFIAMKFGCHTGSSGSSDPQLPKYANARPARMMCSRDIGLPVLENQHSTLDRPSPGSLDGGSRSTIEPSTNFDLDLKHESLSDS